jgi:hypothetical protein
MRYELARLLRRYSALDVCGNVLKRLPLKVGARKILSGRLERIQPCRAYWILIREKVPAPVIERILRQPEGRVRRQDRRYATRRATLREPEQVPLSSDLRVNHLTSQRVEVALVFQSMLGTDAAAEYLRNAGVPIWVTSRVLGSTQRRPSPALVAE